MFRYGNGQFKVNPPATVVYNGFKYGFNELTREQWDELGYNEAVSIKRDPFTTYTTEWMKGEDLIYRETVTSTVVDDAARTEAVANTVRAERDTRLSATDWTQLVDCPLDDLDIVLWQSYRQALRDVPQQAGFPDSVEWPEEPAQE